MQAQEYAHAKWAIALRVPGQTDDSIEKAFNEGRILRTHIMRPTWHFVVPEDIRWMQELTAHRVHQANAYMYRQEKLTPQLLLRCLDVFRKELEGNRYKTREELAVALEASGMPAKSHRLAYFMMHAELENVITSGPRQGKQFTYALLEERAPQAKSLPREEALNRFTTMYFSTRGPATVADMVWWSGLTVKEVKEGIALAGNSIEKINIDKKEYWMGQGQAIPEKPSGLTYLMPDYDEYGIAYRDRTELLAGREAPPNTRTENPIYDHMLVVDGLIAGRWRRTLKAKTVAVEVFPNKPLNQRQQKTVAAAVTRYVKFLGKKLEN